MQVTRIRLTAACITVVVLFCRADTSAAQPVPPAAFRPVVEALQQSHQRGEIVGGQIAIGNRDGLLLSQSLGAVSPDSPRKVDRRTMFCIGSCSKPFASTCLLMLAEEGVLDLDAPISNSLPAFEAVRVAGQTQPTVAPTLRQLLAHRGGIYSQKEKITRDQRQAIYNFTRTLQESVELISQYELIATPGSRFAYSGAGYCVAGRVAEVETRQTFDAILQQRICRPLELRRTTYFPQPSDKNVAVAGIRNADQVAINRQAPCLQGENLKMQLIGGSIYSTAEETARFARLIARRGSWGDKQVVGQKVLAEMTRRQYDAQDYGLGWRLTFADGELVSLGHSGALSGYRSVVEIDVASGLYLVAHRTLADSGDQQLSRAQGVAITEAFHRAVDSLRP